MAVFGEACYAPWKPFLPQRQFAVSKKSNFKPPSLSRPGILHAPEKFSLSDTATATPTIAALSSYPPYVPRIPIHGWYFIHTAVTSCKSVTAFGSIPILPSRPWIPHLSDIPLFSDSSTSECKTVFQKFLGHRPRLHSSHELGIQAKCSNVFKMHHKVYKNAHKVKLTDFKRPTWSPKSKIGHAISTPTATTSATLRYVGKW
jgi:hypothetical protein